MKKKIIYTMLALTLAVAMVAGGTMAWFTDEASAGQTTFTAGTLKIGVSEGLTTFDSLIELGSSKHGNMNPGDVYDEIVIEIENNGTKNLAWFGNWTFSPAGEVSRSFDKLLDAIYIDTMKMEFLDEDGNLWNGDPWYSGYNFIENGVGSGPHPSEVAEFNKLIDPEMGVITLRRWNDNPSMVPGTPYEHMGALKGNSGNKYRLTVKFGFHKNAGNEFQGDALNVAPINVGFEVEATQINVDALNHMRSGLGTHYTWLNNQIGVQP